MGQVSGGFLKCSGSLRKVSWLYQEESPCAVILRDVDELADEDSKISFAYGALDTIELDNQPHLW
jgi:hypothetical protein